MNMMAPITAVDPILTRTEVAGLVALAARTVPPVWPLESAIAVNPLAGFEDLPFEEAVRQAAARFGASRSLPLAQWRKLLAAGKVEERVLRDAAIEKLGGLNAAFELIGPDISQLDLLMARLLHVPVSQAERAPAALRYAGFFGLPIALHRHGDARRARLLPVLLSPQHDVAEAPMAGRDREAAAFAAGQAQARQASALFDAGKQGTATAFATAEATGPLAGLLMAARTVAPGLTRRLGGLFSPAREEAFGPALERHGEHGAQATFTLEEKVGFALALFRLTGLGANTARLVALVGHGGSAVNNPYAAALDCGACGGHAGGSNARILAAILNDPQVRAGLAAKGIAIPEATWFLAAEHNTTTDEVVMFDRYSIPETHREDLRALAESLARAGTANRQRRAALLGRTADDLLTGAMHWGEVRPEWGLAGNAAFIVGPRALTRDIDLEGRAFLHSYDWRSDHDGTALTTILTAPMVVAQWINCQYLFSTIDNERYGSGDKVTQNVVGGIGVLQGNGGDLRVGLPKQSLFTDDGTPFHVPQRLLTVVLAPFDLVERVVESNDILGRLFGNGWVTLVVIDPHTGKALRWSRDDETGSGSAR